MAIYRYNVDYPATNDQSISITVEHLDEGTGSSHVINLPNTNSDIDHLFNNESTVDVGKSSVFKNEDIKIYSKALNIDSAQDKVALAYFVNGTKVVDHSNPKEEDTTPRIKITLKIIES